MFAVDHTYYAIPKQLAQCLPNFNRKMLLFFHNKNDFFMFWRMEL